MDKKQIREMITRQKRLLTETDILNASRKLTDVFCSLDEFRSADCLYAYISFNQEIRTQRIIETALAQGKRVAVPKVAGRDLVFHYITRLDDMERSGFGIPEPADELECADGKESNILMLLPGLAFDRRGARIGYGKGYYDRYLSRYHDVCFYKIALCYRFQLLDHIDTEVFDQFADRVISL